MPNNVREIELSLNKGTVNDLIIAYLHQIGVIRNHEEVTKLFVVESTEAFHLKVRFEPDIQVINI